MHHRLLSILALSALLSACAESGDVGPMPGTPEAVLETHASAWKANARRAHYFEVREESPLDTTTYACESKDGEVGPCIKVSRCCGDDQRIDTVDTYLSHTERLARLRTELRDSGYQAAGSGPSSFTVQKRAVNGKEITWALGAYFNPEYGYLRKVSRSGSTVAASTVTITRLEFK